MSGYKPKPGDVAALITSGGVVKLVRISKCNSRRIISYLVPGRTKPIAATAEAGEVTSIAEYQKAAGRLYDKTLWQYTDIAEARRAIMHEAELSDIEDSI